HLVAFIEPDVPHGIDGANLLVSRGRDRVLRHLLPDRGWKLQLALSHHHEQHLDDHASDQLRRPGTSHDRGHRTARHRHAGLVHDTYLADAGVPDVHALNG